MGYHNKFIIKGILGNISKIEEEYAEFMDAIEQENSVMALIELTDLLGAIEAFTEKNYKINLEQLIKMTRSTQSAFKDGERK
jgi:hypothetical protein